jgi:hypothetical protein
MSEGKQKPDLIPDASQLPAVSDRGVDLTQIRALLKLTPAERLRIGVASSNNAFKLFGRARRK